MPKIFTVTVIIKDRQLFWLKPMIVSLVDTLTNTGIQVTMITIDLYIIWFFNLFICILKTLFINARTGKPVLEIV